MTTAAPALRPTGLDLAICAGILALTLALYAPVRHHEFVNYDDPEYVTENDAVRAGLTAASIRWALTHAHQATWHPLTSLSHLLDVTLFGLRAGPHLVVNAVWHALASVALFLVLLAMTDARWPSAWVAAMFAWHPLHVESVAWVSERKDVLSGLLFMLTLACYLAAVRRPSRARQLALAAVFALGLMAKPMLVTVPFVLLLLDAWPLGRLRPATAARLVREKLPLVALAIAVSAVTVVAQERAGAIGSLATTPLSYRIGNALVSCVTYLRKVVWPSDLAVFYPPPALLPFTTALAAGLALLAITALAWRRRHDAPSLLVGWLWYLGMLVPVLGLVRQGDQAMADRFTYLPLIGVFVAIAWGVSTRFAGAHRGPVALAAALCLAASGVATSRQVGYWENSETLFRHALAVTTDNYVAHTNLGAALINLNGRNARDESAVALQHFQRALAIAPAYARAHLNLGLARARAGQTDAALAAFADAQRVDPGSATVEYNWGLVLAERGETAEAIRHYERALAIDPRSAKTANNLGWALAQQGQLEEAVTRYRQALAVAPDLIAAHNNLAVALEGLGRSDEALEQYRHTVELAPDEARAHANYAALLAGRGRFAEAITAYREAVRLAPDAIEIRGALATTYAEAGRPREARAEAETALTHARATGASPDVVAELERMVVEYPSRAVKED